MSGLSKIETDEIHQAVRDLVAPIEDLDAQLAQREAHILNELDEVQGERRRLRKLIEVATGEGPKKKGAKRTVAKEPSPGARKDGMPTVSEEIIAIVALAVSEMDDEWTSVDVIEKLPQLSKEKVRKSLVHLRERGSIRLVHMARGRGGSYSYRTTPKGKNELQPAAIGGPNGDTETP